MAKGPDSVFGQMTKARASNFLGGFFSYEDENGTPQWCFDSRFKEAAGLRFEEPQGPQLEAWDRFFEGTESSARLMELWYLSCYRVLRDRGLWSPDIASEQRLCDELYPPYSGSQRTAVAIQ